MVYLLSAIGRDLAQPVEKTVRGDLDHAIDIAEGMLQCDAIYEAIEIFEERRFIFDVARKLNGDGCSAEFNTGYVSGGPIFGLHQGPIDLVRIDVAPEF